jgi:hypothetical protein
MGDCELQYLIHFFTDMKFLFKTITMECADKYEEVSEAIASKKGWYFCRYTKSDWNDYLNRRIFVEKELYIEYSKEYGKLKENIPVYFYLYPNITKEKAVDLAKQRMNYNELTPRILFLKIQELRNISNITFTLNDSFTSYWKKAIESGIKCRDEEKGREVLPDHNKIFPFSRIEHIHRVYKEKNPYYEVQIWDYEILEKLNYEIL